MMLLVCYFNKRSEYGMMLLVGIFLIVVICQNNYKEMTQVLG